MSVVFIPAEEKNQRKSREPIAFVTCIYCIGQRYVEGPGGRQRCLHCRGTGNQHWIEHSEAVSFHRKRIARIMAALSAVLAEEAAFGYEMSRSGKKGVRLTLTVEEEAFTHAWRALGPEPFQTHDPSTKRLLVEAARAARPRRSIR